MDSWTHRLLGSYTLETKTLGLLDLTLQFFLLLYSLISYVPNIKTQPFFGNLKSSLYKSYFFIVLQVYVKKPFFLFRNQKLRPPQWLRLKVWIFLLALSLPILPLRHWPLITKSEVKNGSGIWTLGLWDLGLLDSRPWTLWL